MTERITGYLGVGKQTKSGPITTRCAHVTHRSALTAILYDGYAYIGHVFYHLHRTEPRGE